MTGSELGQTFDATQVEPATGKPPPLPDDWYNVLITASENKRAKSNPNNSFTEVTLKVADGPYAGRLAWDRLNLWNDNPTAVEIAQKTLSAICHATGVFQINAVSELHGIPLMAKIVEVDPDGKWDAKNDVKGYAAYGSKVSQNGQGIKLEPRNNDAPPTPGAPSAAGTPTFTPPAAPTSVAPAAPTAPTGTAAPPAATAPAAWSPETPSAPREPAPPAAPPAAAPAEGNPLPPTPAAVTPPAAPAAPADAPPAVAPWATPPTAG